MIKTFLAGAVLVLGLLPTAFARTDQYANWQYSGSIYILTTPEGANLPAAASEEGFPLLVRLDKDWFNGDDIRFASATGTPLAYQIEDWDASVGMAAIWVRIPTIKGNAHQELKMFWGKADAASDSSGKAVFNASNGYLTVFHLNDPAKDETGTLAVKNQGTTPSSGVIGQARHFTDGKGINGGENITGFPSGSDPHSSELWFRAEKSGDRILCWGSGGPRTMVQMILSKPPRMHMDCYGAGASLSAKSPIPLSEWVHVIHTCKPGEFRLYVNGILDAVSMAEDSPMEIKSPVKAYSTTLQAKGAGVLPYTWSASGLAVIQEIASGKLILQRSQNSGKLTVTVTASNGGRPVTQAIQIVVKEPANDVWAQRTPDKDEKPVDNQFCARDDKYEATTKHQDLTHTDSPWIRSFGGNGEVGGEPTTGGWGNARVERLTPTSHDRIHFISVWGMALAKKLVEDQKIPICILNGAFGGTRIVEHMPDQAKHAGQPSRERAIYNNLKKRVIAAKLTHGIRGLLWHQGEADQGFDGPDNCYGCETYQQYWVDLTAAWKQDYPNLRHYYLFQIWPNACSQGGTRNSDKLRDVQRRLSRLCSSLSVMPTLHISSGANCHFKTDDCEKMGLSMVPLLERDSYGKVFDQPVTSADLKQSYYTTARKDEIALEFDQPVAWHDALASQFHLDGEAGKVASGNVSGNVLKLKLAAPAAAKTITCLIDKKWNPKTLLYGRNGIAALTFCEVPIKA